MSFWIVTVLTVVTAALLVWVLDVLNSLRWGARETQGSNYFGRTLAERRKLKAEIARVADRVVPVLRIATRLKPPKRLPSMCFEGVTGPTPICSPNTYEAAKRYEPDERDVFVATQMKCGTTWMQQVVYEVLSRGKGDLGDDGHRHLYALSPWIEAPRSSVSMDAAPRIGARKNRIVKTHMPTQLCPYSPKARYIYVTRHPVACFGSTVDFVSMLMGPLVPTRETLLDWYCSDEMWWRSWPEHVEGWWRWAQERPNVLSVHYEEMLEDLKGVVHRVADFLEVPTLSAEEWAEIVRKSGFAYMKENEEVFEMAPPSPLASTGSFLASGSREREKQGCDAERDRILAFCRERLRGASYPAERFYPDLR